MKKTKFEEVRKYIKYNEDDILEILSEYLYTDCETETIQSKAALIGEPGKDLRFVAVVGDGEDDEIAEVDLEDIDRTIEFNGSH
ncbi:hypothetical protein ACNHOZ_24205 [Priestia sp. D51]